jgi:DNA-3-methyladenine glycosylase II
VTAEELRRARRHLMRRDPVLGALVKRVGPCGLTDARTREPFLSLVRVIASQQLSTSAASTIFNRVVVLAGGAEQLTSARLLELDPADLRTAGLSRPKIGYLVDLASRVEDGRLDLAVLEHATDDDAAAAIMSVKGMGRWSADMFLMFKLCRPDILPVGDLGIVKGFQKLYGMRKPPAERTMRRLAEPWRPYRSVACWYLWRLHD